MIEHFDVKGYDLGKTMMMTVCKICKNNKIFPVLESGNPETDQSEMEKFNVNRRGKRIQIESKERVRNYRGGKLSIIDY